MMKLIPLINEFTKHPVPNSQRDPKDHLELKVLGAVSRLLSGQTTLYVSTEPFPVTTGLGVGAFRIMVPVRIQSNSEGANSQVSSGTIILYVKTLT
jgi:hypothetical protein